MKLLAAKPFPTFNIQTKISVAGRRKDGGFIHPDVKMYVKLDILCCIF